MAPTAGLIADNDITVTSATQSEDAVRAHFETPAEKPVADGAPTTEKADAVTKKDGDVAGAKPAVEDKTLEAEADSTKPDEQLSEAARTLRRSRFDERRKQKQSEIDGLTKTAGELKREIEALQRQATTLRPATPATGEKPKADADTTTRREPAAPEFKFPTWEEWQEQTGNEDKSHSDYIDARTDARYDYNERQRADRVQRERAADGAREAARAFKTHEDDFRKDHPDYDDALGAVSVSDEQLASPQWQDLKRLVAKEGKTGVQVMYHLAKSPEDLALLLHAASRADLFQEFGAIKRTVLRAGSAAPSGAAPAGEKPAAGAERPVAQPPKPTSSAPAPVTPVTGGATPGRTLASVAEESDDADGYIEQRGMGRLLKRA